MNKTYNDIVNKEILNIFDAIKKLNKNLSEQEKILSRSKKIAKKAQKNGDNDAADFQNEIEQPRLESYIQDIENKIEELNARYSMLKLMCLENISLLVKAQNERKNRKLISDDVQDENDILNFPMPRQLNHGNLEEYLYTQINKLTREKAENPDLQHYYDGYISKFPEEVKSYDTKVSALSQIVEDDLAEKRRSDSDRIKRLLKKPILKVMLFTATVGTLAGAICFSIAPSKKTTLPPDTHNPPPTHDALSSDDLEGSSLSTFNDGNSNIVIEGVPDGYTANYVITEDGHLNVAIFDSNNKKVASQKFDYNGEDISIPVTVGKTGNIYIQPPVSEKDLEGDERG